MRKRENPKVDLSVFCGTSVSPGLDLSLPHKPSNLGFFLTFVQVCKTCMHMYITFVGIFVACVLGIYICFFIFVCVCFPLCL